MRILMTQRALSQIAGSEMVTVEVAKALAARGHEITVYSPKVGDIAKMLLPSGVRIARELRDVSWSPDLIHGQHHLPAMAAIARFPEASAIYYCHGTQPWVERPPISQRIGKYVMMCEWMVPRAQAEFGLPPERVTSVPNFVNTTRFSEVRKPPAQIKKALVFGGARLPDDELARLEAACAALHVKLDKIGQAYQSHGSRPEVLLQQYDLVFAIGKCALEAMATGCPVIPILPGQAGSLITSASFDEWSFSNFSPRYFMSSKQISEQWLRKQIASYSVEDLEKITRRVRTERSIESAIEKLEAIYRDVVEAPSAEIGSIDSYAAYLESLANDVDPMWAELEGVHHKRRRVKELEEKLQQAAQREQAQQAELLRLYRAANGTRLPRERRYAASLIKLWKTIRGRTSRKAVERFVPAE